MASEYRDAVCGAKLEPETILASVEYGGETFVFCSEQCGTEFIADPARHSGVHAAASEPLRLERHEPPYTKWGPIVAPKFGSAGSGGAEYERLPEAHDDEGPGHHEKRKRGEH